MERFVLPVIGTQKTMAIPEVNDDLDRLGFRG
jgi:hypothetical protein